MNIFGVDRLNGFCVKICRSNISFCRISLIPATIANDDLLTDERWQLVQRIVSSHAFQKSARLRDLLQHITERSIHGHGYELTEQHIGQTVFHKPSGYTPLEDSSVRVHA